MATLWAYSPSYTIFSFLISPLSLGLFVSLDSLHPLSCYHAFRVLDSYIKSRSQKLQVDQAYDPEIAFLWRFPKRSKATYHIDPCTAKRIPALVTHSNLRSWRPQLSVSVWPVKLRTWQFYLEVKFYKVNTRHWAPIENLFVVEFLFSTVALNWHKTTHRKWGNGWDVNREKSGESGDTEVFASHHSPSLVP